MFSGDRLFGICIINGVFFAVIHFTRSSDSHLDQFGCLHRFRFFLVLPARKISAAQKLNSNLYRFREGTTIDLPNWLHSNKGNGLAVTPLELFSIQIAQHKTNLENGYTRNVKIFSRSGRVKSFFETIIGFITHFGRCTRTNWWQIVALNALTHFHVNVFCFQCPQPPLRVRASDLLMQSFKWFPHMW